MITLRELFAVTWSITRVHISARDSNLLLLHEFIFGDSYHLGIGERWDVEQGKLSVIIGKINEHGEPTRGGAEMGWGYKKKSIPDLLMDAPVTHLSMVSRCQSKGYDVYIDVECAPMTVDLLKQSLKDKALVLGGDWYEE